VLCGWDVRAAVLGYPFPVRLDGLAFKAGAITLREARRLQRLASKFAHGHQFQSSSYFPSQKS
jgi:hypothetical protein